MKTILTPLNTLNDLSSNIAKNLNSIALLALRLYVSWVFFTAGLTKIKDWDTTLFLFEEEYNVPFLSPEIAAWMGTAGELVLPVLVSLGLLSRFCAFGLFIVNIVAVISLADIAPAAMGQHMLWGLSLIVIVLWGAGYFSIDRLTKYLNHQND